MASTYIALWEQLVQNLTHLLSLPVAAPPQHPDLVAADHLLEYLCHAAAPDAVTAKVLVIDKQIPGRICQLSCKLYQQDIHGLAVGLATRAWVHLLLHLQQAGVLVLGDAPPSPAAASFQMQVLESGLPQQLPLLLRATADHLDALAPAATAAADGSTSSSSSNSSSAGGSGSSSSSAGGSGSSSSSAGGSSSSSWGVLQVPTMRRLPSGSSSSLWLLLLVLQSCRVTCSSMPYMRQGTALSTRAFGRCHSAGCNQMS